MTTDTIKKIINTYFHQDKDFSLVKLKGDASERCYFRILFNDNTPSKILMVAPTDQETNSEENYISICNHLAKYKVKVPKIYHYDKENNQMLLEDFGDKQLFDIVQTQDKKQILKLYKQAIDQLLLMQTKGSIPDPNCQAFQLSFDTEKLLWELNFFLEHGQKVKGIIPQTDILFFTKQFQEICAYLAKEKRIFTHRDYHSKNLMVQNNEVKIIDFQDARLGLCQYDLVSLLKDAYANLATETVTELINYYIRQKELLSKESINLSRFFYVFDLMTLQRSLKACGSFCYLQVQKHKKGYMPYFPIAFDYAIKSIANKKQYQKLAEKLSFYFDKK